MASLTPIPQKVSSFPTTRWSVVERARFSDSPDSLEARAYLCEVSWYPIYAFVRRRGHRYEEAYDLTQGFFEHLFEKEILRKISADRGRFRSYILKALRNFISDQQKRESRLKRGGHVEHFSFDNVVAEKWYSNEPCNSESPEIMFERRWAKGLFARVLTRLGNEYVKGGQEDRFHCFKACLFEGGGNYAEKAAQLDLTESAFGAALSRFRKRYRELIRLEIADFVLEPGEIDDEYQYLIQVLRR